MIQNIRGFDQNTTLDSHSHREYRTNQMSALRVIDLGALHTSQIGNLPPMQIHALGSQQISALGSPQVSALTTTMVSALKSSQVSALRSSQVSALKSSEVSVLRSSQVSALRSSQVSALRSSQVSSLGSTQVSALAPTRVEALSAQSLSRHTTELSQALQQFAHQVQALSPSGSLNDSSITTLALTPMAQVLAQLDTHAQLFGAQNSQTPAAWVDSLSRQQAAFQSTPALFSHNS